MRVLITGATGFIGSHVAHVLIAMGCDVIVTARSNRKLAELFPGCRSAELDFTGSCTTGSAIIRVHELSDTPIDSDGTSLILRDQEDEPAEAEGPDDHDEIAQGEFVEDDQAGLDAEEIEPPLRIEPGEVKEAIGHDAASDPAEEDDLGDPDPVVAKLVDLLDQVDIVINTVGIIAEKGTQTFQQIHLEFPRCLFRASVIAGVRRFIQISAIGAEADAQTAYHRSKHQADALLRTLNMEYVIVKPSLVYGGEGASSTFFAALAAQPLHPLVDGGRQQVQPIHIDDLAEAVARLGLMEFPPDEIDAVGPEAMSFRQMLAAYRQWLGYGPLRAIPVPAGLVLAVTRLTGFFSKLLRRDNILMLLQGNTGNAATIGRVLGHAPRPFEQALRQMPVQAQRCQARLYFLIPALRIAIAFVWIFTGIVSAFVYPVEESLALLAQVGLSGSMATTALYAAAALDILIGIAVLLRYRMVLTGLLQLAVMGAYTTLISIYLPGYWLHPYGPISKNIPFLVGVLILMAVSDRRGE